MSIDKFTSRGFGSSGAGRSSSWSAPRESYKAPTDQGSSFLFGGAGLRGSPQSGAQNRAIPQGGGSQLTSQLNRLGEKSDPLKDSDRSERSRGIDLSGGDETTTSMQRRFLFLSLFVGALLLSFVIRACAGGSSDTSWIDDRRSHINPDDE
jgi:hypothetical protein